MGNVALCAPSILSSGVIKVLSSEGRLLIYTTRPIKAAEIMVENPGQFLCRSTNLKIGQRIPGITAEEELQRGRVYFLLPMDMLYSVLTNEELKGLSQKASKGIKQLNFSKIFPEFCLFPNGAEGKTGEDCAGTGNGDLEKVERFCRQRSWQPALETIVETPPHSY